MTPDVPILHNVFPEERIPAPTAPQALSAPPAYTFVFSSSPVFAKDSFYTMGVTLAAGYSLDWFKRTFAPNESFEQLLQGVESVPIGANGLLYTLTSRYCIMFFRKKEYRLRQHRKHYLLPRRILLFFRAALSSPQRSEAAILHSHGIP